MAHFAKLENNVVKEVMVIDNINCGGGDFPASEPIGQVFIASLGIAGEWKQASFNNNFRNIYPYPNDTYDPVLNVFVKSIPPKPSEDDFWIWDADSFEWTR